MTKILRLMDSCISLHVFPWNVVRLLCCVFGLLEGNLWRCFWCKTTERLWQWNLQTCRLFYLPQTQHNS